MTARPIIFGAPMIQALIDGRKRQTRRVVKPTFKYAAGDFLWVREAWQFAPQRYCSCPQGAEPSPCDDWCDGAGCASNRDGVVYRADGDRAPYWRSPIHMPRWASRLTAEITELRTESLENICEEDAKAEGLRCLSKDGGRIWKWGLPESDGLPGAQGWHWPEWCDGHRAAFAKLWNSIHGDGAWERNPQVAVISFDVHHSNIDRLLASQSAAAPLLAETA